MGGDRFNNVVTALYDALPPAGATAVRFDFGTADIEAAATEAVETLELLPDRPRFLIGYSFGGGVAATIADDGVDGWFLVAPALTSVESAIGDDPRPKAVVAAEHDQFFPPAQLEAATKDWRATQSMTIAGADHFFVGRADAVAQRCVEWLRARV